MGSRAPSLEKDLNSRIPICPIGKVGGKIFSREMGTRSLGDSPLKGESRIQQDKITNFSHRECHSAKIFGICVIPVFRLFMSSDEKTKKEPLKMEMFVVKGYTKMVWLNKCLEI